MKSALFVLGLTLATPALADTASFRQAFNDICLQSLPTMASARAAFQANGWEEYQGMGVNEFEYIKSETQVFLSIGAPQIQPGCFIQDNTLAEGEAEQILVQALDKHFEGDWKKGTGYYDRVVWRLLLETGTVTFLARKDENGDGGSITFKLQP